MASRFGPEYDPAKYKWQSAVTRHMDGGFFVSLPVGRSITI